MWINLTTWKRNRTAKCDLLDEELAKLDLNPASHRE
jgi:hypothetical protein